MFVVGAAGLGGGLVDVEPDEDGVWTIGEVLHQIGLDHSRVEHVVVEHVPKAGSSDHGGGDAEVHAPANFDNPLLEQRLEVVLGGLAGGREAIREVEVGIDGNDVVFRPLVATDDLAVAS